MNRRTLTGFLLALVASMLLWWWPNHSPEPVWEPVTGTFNPEHCLQGQCRELLRLPASGKEVASLIVDPAVDDAIAQWSDCLASVAVCVETAESADTADILLSCVRESQCPASCRELFARESDGVEDIDALWQRYEQQFVDKGGACVPAG